MLPQAACKFKRRFRAVRQFVTGSYGAIERPLPLRFAGTVEVEVDPVLRPCTRRQTCHVVGISPRRRRATSRESNPPISGRISGNGVSLIVCSLAASMSAKGR